MEVTELQNKIARKDAALEKMTNSRATLEERTKRLVEERDRLAQINKDLLAVKSKGELMECVRPNMEEDAELDLAVKLSEIDSLKKEKEMMTQEILDLQNEIKARELEV